MAEESGNKIDKLHDLIKDIRFAMFTTRAANGTLRSRPMTTQGDRSEQQDCLWFFASRSGEPVAELQADPIVNLAYADPGSDTYVSVCGSATVVEDPVRKQQMWSKFAQAWFPDGPDDPDLALVRVQINEAEYWDVKESKPTQLFKMAKAVFTKEPPTGMGDHGKIVN